jgi:PiT family inorganic phosphate transporter
MLFIFASWVISPLCSGLIAYWIFTFLQNKILFDLNPVSAAKKLTPLFVFFAFAFFSLGLVYQGLANLHIQLTFFTALIYSSAVGSLASLLSYFLVKKIPIPLSIPEERPHHVISLEKAAKHLERTHLTARGETQEKAKKILEEIQALASSIKEKSPLTHASLEYTQVEKIFGYLQIISACLVAFAHGANDVANAIGPVAAVFQTLSSNAIGTSTYVPSWLLAFGGIGIVIGLSTWGWRVIETIGKKITELTPTRGFSAEFGASLTILLASKLGLPISTTHALVGAVLGVGLARGLSALNLKTLKDILLSWLVTIPSCAILSILCFYVLKAFFY